jgi:hypothetical protein
MKSKTELKKIYDKATGEHPYYSLEDFSADAKTFLKDCRNRTTYCSIKAAPSGMSRKFNFDRYNMLLNICYNGKFSWEPVKVNGCGMDMHWYLKFTTCEALATKAECEKYNYNSACSSGKVL